MKCRIIKWVVGCRVDDGVALGHYLTQHLKGCAACRVYYQRQVRMHGLLETQALSETCQRGELLERVIFDSLSATHVWPEPARRPGHRSILAIAASVFVIASLTLTGMHMMAQKKAKTVDQATMFASMASLSRQLAPTQLLATYGPWVQMPLESEMKNLSMDAQNAARFLVQCTPFAKSVSETQ